MQRVNAQQQSLLIAIPRVAFYFVRHGQTDWNLANRVQGNTDIPLNEIGKKQAENAAKRLISHGITSICHSPLSRAKVTAEIIGGIQKASLYEIDDLKEIFAGKSEGKLKPEGFNFVERQPAEFFVDAESADDFLVRVVRGVAHALEQPGPVCIVSHGGVFRYLRIHLGLDPFLVENASIVKFVPQETGWVMMEIM